jgi:hypothetical protein
MAQNPERPELSLARRETSPQYFACLAQVAFLSLQPHKPLIAFGGHPFADTVIPFDLMPQLRLPPRSSSLAHFAACAVLPPSAPPIP